MAIGLSAAVVWYVFAHRDELTAIEAVPLWGVALIVGVRMIAYVASVEAVRRLMAVLGQGIGAPEFLLVSGIGSILSSVAIPWSGYALKTVYMKKRHRLAHRDFLAINAVIGIGTLGVSGVLAIAALVTLQAQGEGGDPILWFGATAMAGSPLALLVADGLVAWAPPLRRLFAGRDRWRAMVKARPTRLALGILLAARCGLNFVGFGLLLMLLAPAEAGLVAGGLVDALSSFLRLVRLVPGNLGLYEWSVAALGGVLGVPLMVGIVAAAAYRICGLAGIVILTGVLAILRPRVEKRASQPREEF